MQSSHDLRDRLGVVDATRTGMRSKTLQASSLRRSGGVADALNSYWTRRANRTYHGYWSRRSVSKSARITAPPHTAHSRNGASPVTATSRPATNEDLLTPGGSPIRLRQPSVGFPSPTSEQLTCASQGGGFHMTRGFSRGGLQIDCLSFKLSRATHLLTAHCASVNLTDRSPSDLMHESARLYFYRRQERRKVCKPPWNRKSLTCSTLTTPRVPRCNRAPFPRASPLALHCTL